MSGKKGDRLRSLNVEMESTTLLLARGLRRASPRDPATDWWAGLESSRSLRTVGKVGSCVVLEAEMRVRLA